MLRSRLAHDLEVLERACAATAYGFTDERAPMNWTHLPWKKLVLLAGGGGLTAVAANIPESITIFGISVQHVLLLAAGAVAGWAKRAPGDIKAPPLNLQ